MLRNPDSNREPPGYGPGELPLLYSAIYFLNIIFSLIEACSTESNSTSLSGRPGLNRRPSRWQRDALPTELLPRLLGTITKYHFDCNFYISVKITSKFLSLAKARLQNLFNDFTSKSKNFVAKAYSATAPNIDFKIKKW